MHDIEEFREAKGQCKEKPLNSLLKRKNLFLDLTRKTMRLSTPASFIFSAPIHRHCRWNIFSSQKTSRTRQVRQEQCQQKQRNRTGSVYSYSMTSEQMTTISVQHFRNRLQITFIISKSVVSLTRIRYKTLLITDMNRSK